MLLLKLVRIQMRKEVINSTLSENRAKNVVEYLISKGVDSSRLIGIGYSETKLLNNCNNGSNCTDQQHLTNRRTEFKVF